MKTSTRICVAVSVCLLLAVGVSYAWSSAEESYIRGLNYAAEGKFEEAKIEFKKAVEAGGFVIHAEESLKVIEDAITRRIKKETAVHLFKGAAYGNEGMLDEQIAEYTKAIELNPDYAKAYNNRGIIYDSKDQQDKAIADFSKAIELNPGYAEAYYNRGVTRGRDKGQYDLAVADFSKAIEFDPKFVVAYNNRGFIYSRWRQYDLALADYNEAIKINPAHASAYNNRAISFYYKNEYDRAWEDVRKAQSLGMEVHPGFLKALREASGRDK